MIKALDGLDHGSGQPTAWNASDRSAAPQGPADDLNVYVLVCGWDRFVRIAPPVLGAQDEPAIIAAIKPPYAQLVAVTNGEDPSILNLVLAKIDEQHITLTNRRLHAVVPHVEDRGMLSAES